MTCLKCKRELPIERFAWTPASDKSPRRRSRRCSGCKRTATTSVKRWHKLGRECSRCGQTWPCPAAITDYPWRDAICKACSKASERERQKLWSREKRANDPAFRRRQIDATLRWQARHPEYVVAAERARYERIKADPERWERHKEDARMRYRLRQERIGRPSKPVTSHTYIKRYGDPHRGPRIDATPLRELLHEVLETSGLPGFAEEAGYSFSFVHRVWMGRYKTLAVSDADALCVSLGMPLNLVYHEAA